jgi:hypothetical protein
LPSSPSHSTSSPNDPSHRFTSASPAKEEENGKGLHMQRERERERGREREREDCFKECEEF